MADATRSEVFSEHWPLNDPTTQHGNEPVECRCGVEFGSPTDWGDHLDAMLSAAGIVWVRRPDAANPTPALTEAAYCVQDDLSKPPDRQTVTVAAEIIDSYIDARDHDVVHVLGHAANVAAAAGAWP